jgi:hypothetical protein
MNQIQRYRMCERKKPYPYRAQARNRAAQVSRETGELINAYECPNCGMWHIGHTDPPRVLPAHFTTLRTYDGSLQ